MGCRMVNQMRAHKLATVTEARLELAAEVRDLANWLESQEADYLVLHDSWEVLVELDEGTECLRTRFLQEQPEQEAWLIEKAALAGPEARVDREGQDSDWSSIQVASRRS
jgi:hypothetical protein